MADVTRRGIFHRLLLSFRPQHCARCLTLWALYFNRYQLGLGSVPGCAELSDKINVRLISGEAGVFDGVLYNV